MTLFEIETSWWGESYCRAYVWAESKEQALELFFKANPLYGPDGERKNSVRDVKVLLDRDSPPFSTIVSDQGWET